MGHQEDIAPKQEFGQPAIAHEKTVRTPPPAIGANADNCNGSA
jgi:hypothetical protein